MAWGLVTRATLHAFPHRDRELREYAGRVILLDEAIRRLVATTFIIKLR